MVTARASVCWSWLLVLAGCWPTPVVFPCAKDHTCPDDLKGDAYQCIAGTCRKECSSAWPRSVCADGQKCQVTLGVFGFCADSCSDERPCSDGLVCRNGYCAKCQSSLECAAGQCCARRGNDVYGCVDTAQAEQPGGAHGNQVLVCDGLNVIDQVLDASVSLPARPDASIRDSALDVLDAARDAEVDAAPLTSCASLAGDFSASQLMNPTGPWSYGQATSPQINDFALFAVPFTVTASASSITKGVVGWSNEGYNSLPLLSFNPTGAMAYGGIAPATPTGTASFPPNMVIMHPSSSRYSVARWTSAVQGRVSLNADFKGASGLSNTPKTTTEIVLSLNGEAIQTALLNIQTSGNTGSFSEMIDLEVGDTIDIAVGKGNGNFGYDSTQVDVTICSAANGLGGLFGGGAASPSSRKARTE